MHVFITGGTGLTGPAVVSELITGGHEVTGLARSDASAAKLEALGATALRGAMEDLEVLTAGAEAADGVIHMAFTGDFTRPNEMTAREVAAITALGDGLVDTGKPLVTTSGTLVMRAGSVSHEADPSDPDAIAALRIPGEQACLGFADRGVRASVVRLSPTVHGPRDAGFVPMLIAHARRTGVSAYVGEGQNRWPAVHRLDAAVLYRLALEQAPAGQAVHGVGERAIPFRAIAEKIGERLGLPAQSVSPEAAADHFGNPFMAKVFATDAPASSEATQALLGWTPTHPTLLEDLTDGDYFDAAG